MAFNFNWSPLTADAGFYTRAQELLTAALNKSPKPPIIVDDILVNELNLGHVPPELEILEIGDLAEDRFRGIFKMSYNGDAFLTLKTRVQANPLNTYLLTRPAFGSPQPLAAATGLTIPLQITLSDIKLSAFIILVFSRQKGLTLVFRNDPLESLKVSSTFDSIPFVANYLQKEIEGQLRILLMDELPAIIHRLSLRLWVPEHKAREDQELKASETSKNEPIIDPLASPPQDPVDSTGHALNPTEIASLSLDSGVETQSLFSQKNLIRLATLSDSHRTLSLFTPSIRDAVFRAWAGPIERGELTGLHTRITSPALSRSHSYVGSLSSTYSFDNGSQIRPSLHSTISGTASHGIGMGSGRHAKAHSTRKRKKRVVNLRKQPESGEMEQIIEDGSSITDTASATESSSSAPSVFSAPPAAFSSPGILRDFDLVTPPTSPRALRHGKNVEKTSVPTEVSPTGPAADFRAPPKRSATLDPFRVEPQGSSSGRGWDDTLRPPKQRPLHMSADLDATPRASMYLPERPRPVSLQAAPNTGKESPEDQASSSPSQSQNPLPNFLQFIADPANGGSIAERAWMVKMASEVSRRYEEEREKGSFASLKRDEDETPPPAYAR